LPRWNGASEWIDEYRIPGGCCVHRVEALWTKILGVLLIVLGITLFVSPYISYSTKERIAHTALRVKREKTVLVSRPVAVTIIAAGVVALAFGCRKTHA
jgi:hypothetical protein